MSVSSGGVTQHRADLAESLEYHVVDVFTDRAFAGNPLAVVLGADALADHQLQALAREFHLSETAFPVDPGGEGADYRLRIFTPSVELPFAGHPRWVRRGRWSTSGGSRPAASFSGAALVICPLRWPSTAVRWS